MPERGDAGKIEACAQPGRRTMTSYSEDFIVARSAEDAVDRLAVESSLTPRNVRSFVTRSCA
jgi:hypothetical protein